jgi:hypothetical protein
MIDTYFRDVEKTLQEFPNIRSSTLKKKQYNARQGYISGSIHFDSGCRLEFMELKDTDRSAKIKYRYQYMDQQNTRLFRYDNAPHHPNITTHPHHKHNGEEIIGSCEPTLFDVLLEIAEQERVGG